jgi:hypothetical protein
LFVRLPINVIEAVLYIHKLGVTSVALYGLTIRRLIAGSKVPAKVSVSL